MLQGIFRKIYYYLPSGCRLLIDPYVNLLTAFQVFIFADFLSNITTTGKSVGGRGSV